MKLLFDESLSPRLVESWSTDSDFEGLLSRVPAVNVVILGSCNYPTEVAAEVLRRNAIRITELPSSKSRLIILDR